MHIYKISCWFCLARYICRPFTITWLPMMSCERLIHELMYHGLHVCTVLSTVITRVRNRDRQQATSTCAYLLAHSDDSFWWLVAFPLGTPAPAGCAYHQNFAYKIVPSITISTSENSSPSKCCALCRKHVECAVFVLDPKKVCTVMSANQGGEGIAGFLSGESA